MTLTIEEQVSQELARAAALGLTPCLVYDRISHSHQEDGLSQDSQRTGALSYTERKGLHPVYIFEVTESARKEGRKGLRALLDVSKKMRIRHLVFKNTSRMSRNLKDKILLDDLIEKHDAHLHFYESGKVLNRETPRTERILNKIELILAEDYSAAISENVLYANKYKLGQGIAPIARPPYGYKWSSEERQHLIDKDVEANLRFIFDEFDSGRHTLRSLARLLNARGIPNSNGQPWSELRTSSLHHLLQNPFFHGEYQRKDGTIHPCNHPPYYEKSRYLRRQELLKSRYKGARKRKRPRRLAGLVFCGSCSGAFTPDLKKVKRAGGRTVEVMYYTHKCPDRISERTGRAGAQISRLESELWEFCDEHVEAVMFGPDFSVDLQKLMHGYFEERRTTLAGDRRKLGRLVADIERKKDNLVDALASGKIDDIVALNARINGYNSQLSALREQLDSISQSKDRAIQTLGQAIDDLRDFRDLYFRGDLDQRSKLLAEMVSRVIVAPMGIEFEWKAPFSALIGKGIPTLEELAAQAAGLVRSHPTMLPRLGSNQRPSD